jgi:hypothetical protein
MERITKNQTIFLMFLLMVSTIVIDGLLESVIIDPFRTSAMSFSLIMGMFWLLEQSPIAKWPKTTLTHKLAFAGVAALIPLIIRMIGLVRNA